MQIWHLFFPTHWLQYSPLSSVELTRVRKRYWHSFSYLTWCLVIILKRSRESSTASNQHVNPPLTWLINMYSLSAIVVMINSLVPHDSCCETKPQTRPEQSIRPSFGKRHKMTKLPTASQAVRLLALLKTVCPLLVGIIQAFPLRNYPLSQSSFPVWQLQALLPRNDPLLVTRPSAHWTRY